MDPPSSPQSLQEELDYVKAKLYAENDRLKERNRLLSTELSLAKEKIKILEGLVDLQDRRDGRTKVKA